MRVKIGALLAMAGLMGFLPSIAKADTFNFSGCPNAGPCSGATGAVESYTVNGLTITATGYKSASTTNNLFIKTDGGDESGLGLVGASDHEVEPGNFIQLDMSNLTAHGITSGTLTLGSVQLGEGYTLCYTNTAGTMVGATCSPAGHLDDTAFSINWTGDRYIDITAKTGDVLLVQETSAPTPEPGTAGLMLLGAAGLLGLTLRRTILGSLS